MSGGGGKKTNPVTFQKPLPSATRIWKLCFSLHQKVIVHADLQTGHVSPLHPSMQKAAKPFLCFISLIWVQRVFLKLVNNVNTCPFGEWVCYLGILCHLINIKQFCVDKLVCKMPSYSQVLYVGLTNVCGFKFFSLCFESKILVCYLSIIISFFFSH